MKIVKNKKRKGIVINMYLDIFFSINLFAGDFFIFFMTP